MRRHAESEAAVAAEAAALRREAAAAQETAARTAAVEARHAAAAAARGRESARALRDVALLRRAEQAAIHAAEADVAEAAAHNAAVLAEASNAVRTIVQTVVPVIVAAAPIRVRVGAVTGGAPEEADPLTARPDSAAAGASATVVHAGAASSTVAGIGALPLMGLTGLAATGGQKRAAPDAAGSSAKIARLGAAAGGEPAAGTVGALAAAMLAARETAEGTRASDDDVVSVDVLATGGVPAARASFRADPPSAATPPPPAPSDPPATPRGGAPSEALAIACCRNCNLPRIQTAQRFCTRCNTRLPSN